MFSSTEEKFRGGDPQGKTLPAARGGLKEDYSTYLICRTVRSGQKYKYPGNAVVMGDIHPGGEVIARGHIIVMGTLKGVVHAGAEGDENAVVLAFRLQPIQLRIAGHITRAPDDVQYHNGTGEPEIAWVQDDVIVIDKYHPGTEKRWLTKSMMQEEVERNG